MNASIFVREKHTEVFKTKHELVLELIEQLPFSRQALLVGDNFYGTQNFVNKLRCLVLSLLKCTAVGYKQPVAPMGEAIEAAQNVIAKKFSSPLFLTTQHA